LPEASVMLDNWYRIIIPPLPLTPQISQCALGEMGEI